jgi:CBS domain-containing protein
MKISSLIKRNVISCTAHDDLQRAAQLMWDHDIGCLPVIDGQGHVIGMITDRDICMAAYTQGLPLRALPVTLAMARRVFACNANDEVASVERRMSEYQIRRMPVIDDQGHPIGIVSLVDIARAASAGQVPASEVASTLTAVSAPRQMSAPAA